MSEKNLPVPYYSPDYKGYRLDRDEFGNPVSFDPIPKPSKYDLVLSKPVDTKIEFAEIECLKRAFNMSDEEAYDAIKASQNRQEGYVVYSGYAQHCDTKGAIIELTVNELIQQGIFTDGLIANAVKLG